MGINKTRWVIMPGATIFIATLLLATSCQTNTAGKEQTSQQADPCLNLKDTFTTISVFSSVDTALPTKDFSETVKFIESKGNLRLLITKQAQIEHKKDIYLPHSIDTCNDKYVTQLFVFKNITATSCYFKSTTPMKGTRDYFPGFNFVQWNFANNTDRDSAYKILRWVHTNDGFYEKRYNQTVIGDKRLYLIETGAKIFEETGIEYAKYLNQYVQSR